MPTLMAPKPRTTKPGQRSAMTAAPLSSPTSVPPPTTTVTLSFGGVDFALHPDGAAVGGGDAAGINEVSYKNTSDGIVLSLASFSGRLVVSKTSSGRPQLVLQPLLAATTTAVAAGQRATDASAAAVGTAKVEEEPDSPEAAGRGVNKVSPGQLKLSFDGSKSAAAAVTPGGGKTRSSKSRRGGVAAVAARKGRVYVGKRTSEQQPLDDGVHAATPKTTNRPGKRSRLDGNDEKENNAGMMSPFLCQQTQSTQDESAAAGGMMPQADYLSQTMPSTTTGSSQSTANPITEQQLHRVPPSGGSNLRVTFEDMVLGNANKDVGCKTKPTSVQDILDQVNSSNDSVTTNRDDEDDDDDATLVMNPDLDNRDAIDAAASEGKDGKLGVTSVAATQGDDDVVEDEDQPKDSRGAEMDLADDDDAAASSSFAAYPPPPARWGHSMTRVQDDSILVYGGQSFDAQGRPVILSDVHVYDVKNRSWHKPINCRGEARQWHTATYIPSRQQVIAFGGETIDVLGGGNKPSKGNDGGGGVSTAPPPKVVTSDTLRVLDTDIMLWYPPAASGDVPTGRSGHTATFFPESNELVLIGGVRGSKWLNSVSVLDITGWIWTTPRVEGSPPKPRSYHSATAVGGNRIVVFGGNNKASCFNTVHVLEAPGCGAATANATTTGSGEHAAAAAQCGWKWSHPTVTGTAPSPRTGHSATLLEDGRTICVYGGWDPNEEDEATGEEQIFKGSYLLNTIDWTWTAGPEAQPGGSGSTQHDIHDCGPKRCGHTATLNPETGEVLVFGGRIPGEVLAGDLQRLVPPQEKAVRLEE